MRHGANIQSVDAVRDFRADLVAYQHKLRQAIELLTLEISRAVDWFDSQQVHWPAELRRASDRVAQARTALSSCLITKGENRPSACFEERKALEQAQARLKFAEQQIRVTRKWHLLVRSQTEEFRSHIARLVNRTDVELPRAIAALDQAAQALDRYVDRTAPRDTPQSPRADVADVGAEDRVALREDVSEGASREDL